MTTGKQRITVTLNPELVDAGLQAVEDGRADSVSAWVSAALEEKIVRDRKLALLDIAIASFEQEFGEITAAELAAVERTDRASAVMVRAPKRRRAQQARSA